MTAALLALAAMTTGPPSAEGWRDGLCSWYGEPQALAGGGQFAPDGLSCAHRTIPLGRRLELRYRERKVRVECNDFGPAKWTGRDLDASRGAARRLGFLDAGVVWLRYREVR